MHGEKTESGCGHDIREGWINLDISPIEGVDVVHDINKLPLPSENGSMDYILCQDVLNTSNTYRQPEELHRILKWYC